MFIRLSLLGIALIFVAACNREMPFEELTGSSEKEILKIVILPTPPMTYKKTIDVKVERKFTSTSSDFSESQFKSQAEVILANGKIIKCKISGVVLTCEHNEKESSYVMSKEVQKAFSEQGVEIVQDWKKSSGPSKGKFKNWGNKPTPSTEEEY